VADYANGDPPLLAIAVEHGRVFANMRDTVLRTVYRILGRIKFYFELNIREKRILNRFHEQRELAAGFAGIGGLYWIVAGETGIAELGCGAVAPGLAHRAVEPVD
jgi:hypothetical protein